MTEQDDNGEEFPEPTPEQIRDAAAETAIQFAEAIILKTAESGRWVQTTHQIDPSDPRSDQSAWMNNYPPLSEHGPRIAGLGMLFVEIDGIRHPMDLLPGNLDRTEWQLKAHDPLRGITHSPEKGLAIFLDGEEIALDDTTEEQWEELAELLKQIQKELGM